MDENQYLDQDPVLDLYRKLRERNEKAQPVTQTIKIDPKTGKQTMTISGSTEDLSSANPLTPTVSQPAAATMSGDQMLQGYLASRPQGQLNTMNPVSPVSPMDGSQFNPNMQGRQPDFGSYPGQTNPKQAPRAQFLSQQTTAPVSPQDLQQQEGGMAGEVFDIKTGKPIAPQETFQDPALYPPSYRSANGTPGSPTFIHPDAEASGFKSQAEKEKYYTDRANGLNPTPNYAPEYAPKGNVTAVNPNAVKSAVVNAVTPNTSANTSVANTTPGQMGPGTELMDPEGWAERFTGAQQDPRMVAEMAFDPNAPKWVRGVAEQHLSNFVDQKRAEKAAQELFAKAQESGDMRPVMREAQRSGSEGSWVKYLLFQGMNLHAAADLEANKLGLKNRTTAAIGPNGESGMITVDGNGNPVSGVRADGTAITGTKLLEWASSQGNKTVPAQGPAGESGVLTYNAQGAPVGGVRADGTAITGKELYAWAAQGPLNQGNRYTSTEGIHTVPGTGQQVVKIVDNRTAKTWWQDVKTGEKYTGSANPVPQRVTTHQLVSDINYLNSLKTQYGKDALSALAQLKKDRGPIAPDEEAEFLRNYGFAQGGIPGSQGPVNPATVAATAQTGTTNPNSLKEVIGRNEGGQAGYDAIFGFGGPGGDKSIPAANGGRNLSQLPIGEALKIMDSRMKDNAGGAGKYGFLPGTVRGLMKSAGLTDQDQFSGENQEKLYEVMTQMNTASLKQAGVEATPRNIYLAQAIGAGNVGKVIDPANAQKNVADMLGFAPGSPARKTNPQLDTTAEKYLSMMANKTAGVSTATTAPVVATENRAVIDKAGPPPVRGMNEPEAVFKARQKVYDKLAADLAEGQAKSTLAFPEYQAQADQILSTINDVLYQTDNKTGKIKLDKNGNPLISEGLKTNVGIPGITGMLQIRGTEARDWTAKYNQLEAEKFMVQFAKLRGAGAISDKEGASASAALAALQDKGISEEAFLRNAHQLEEIIKVGVNRQRMNNGMEPDSRYFLGNAKEAEQAYKWVKQNPNDPRSAEILTRIGIR